MNDGQNQFFQYIMDAIKDGYEEVAKALLNESFTKQQDGNFTMEYLQYFHEQIIKMLKEDKVTEVMAVLNQFGEQHISN